MKYFTINYNYKLDNRLINFIVTTISDTIEESYSLVINNLSSKLTNIKEELTFDNFKVHIKTRDIIRSNQKKSIINIRVNTSYIINDDNIINLLYENYN